MHAHSAQNYNIRMQNYYKKINNSNNYNYNQLCILKMNIKIKTV